MTWDLGDDLLENGVTYTVTFDVWPSQDTLDLIADIKNDPSVYDDLDDTLKQYLGPAGSSGLGGLISLARRRKPSVRGHSTESA